MKKYLLIFSLVIFVNCAKEPSTQKVGGAVFGTTYSVIYLGTEDYQKQFDSLFTVINQSMSTYIPDSDISRINRNEASTVDEHFEAVFKTSRRVHQETNGVFDPTIGAVVNAWDFGPSGAIQELDSLKIDSLMKSVGFDKLKIRNGSLVKQQLNTFIDFNAIAKGYAVDVIAEFLESKEITNLLVEIGGEIRTKGFNPEKNKPWKIGIDLPNFQGDKEVMSAIELIDKAMATSGTYRKFKTDEQGNRYAHIIDTSTGYPAKTNVLSVSVIANDCMTADAYATALQAMEIEKIKTFLKAHPELKVLVIFENDSNELETLALNGFPQ